MEHYLYILKSVRNEMYYIGVSEDPVRRLLFHNSKEKGFTARFRPWVLIYTHKFPDKHKALKAERLVKKMKSRSFIEKVISGEIKLNEMQF